MPGVLEPSVEHPGPPADADGADGRPWWSSVWRLVLLGLALIFLGAAIGYAVTSNGGGAPGAGSVDAGFLQDMRWHHDQAVRMSMIMLAKPPAEQDAGVRTLASDVVLSQQFENGVMAGQLRDWGLPEANESGTGMAWMGMSVPVDRMPGMASEDELSQLRGLSGREADALFLRLMVPHHQGGLHMAAYAAANGSTRAVRELAASIVQGQEFEIGEIQAAQRRLGLAS